MFLELQTEIAILLHPVVLLLVETVEFALATHRAAMFRHCVLFTQHVRNHCAGFFSHRIRPQQVVDSLDTFCRFPFIAFRFFTDGRCKRLVIIIGRCWRINNSAEQTIHRHDPHLLPLAIVFHIWLIILDLLKHAGLEHLAVEVAAVELHTEDALIKALQLRDGELLVEQVEPHRLEVDVLADTLHGLAEDIVMVESQLRNVIYSPPLGFRGIVTALDGGMLGEGLESDGDDALARVTVHAGEGAELAHLGQFQTRLLFEFALGALFSRLVHAEESSGESPHALVGIKAALDEQHLELFAVETEDHAVSSHRRMGVFVSVAFCMIVRVHYLCNFDAKIQHIFKPTKFFVSFRHDILQPIETQ